MNGKTPPSKEDLDLAASIFLEIRMFLFPGAVYVPGSSGERFLAEQFAKVRRDALEEACKAQCSFCEHNFEVEFKGRLGYVHLDKDGRVFADCKADRIRFKLIAAD